jgi:hypothetical protein
MRRWLGALICLPAAACLKLTSGSDGGVVTVAPASSATTGDAASAPPGSDCTQQSAGVTLCGQIAACPGVTVDPGALPGCGFRVGSDAPIDLECVCGGTLCPIGVPESCVDAEELLQGQDSLQVCEQASEGLCLQITESVSDGGNVGAAPGCNTVCESQCAGSPGCIQLCGC